MDYDYEIPDNLKQQLVSSLRLNSQLRLSELLTRVNILFDDVGLAYYAGLRGDNWDKHALDCNIYVLEKDIEELRSFSSEIKKWIQKLLPNKSGLIVRDITFIPQIDNTEVELPEIQGDTWSVLHTDITEALSRNEPSLVLDRLHTFSVKLIRELCEKKKIAILDDKGKQLPLHSLAGMLVKYYKKNNCFQSDFSEQVLKTSISLFDKYNNIRNDQSYAHDNEILNKSEAMLAARIMTATLDFIYEFEEL